MTTHSDPPMAAPGEWRSRGYLPHYESGSVIQVLTYRLADSLPNSVRLKLNLTVDDDERRREIETYLDSGYGSCLLRQSENAELVVSAWHFFDAKRYFLHAWTVMPNHVHVMIEPSGTYEVREIVHSWKSFTAKTLKKSALFGSRLESRRVWQPEYFDRFIRDEDHYRAAVGYIHMNAVKAGLVRNARDWPWSSASLLESVGVSPTL